ncbi:hypothetical protein FRC04_002553 [Tulasnella sp. 424]|nr:hypothetical protein FRC04_002553 [Tulasnella sp. 424]
MNPQWQQQQQQRQQFQAPQQYPQPTGFQPQSSFGQSLASQPTGFQPNAYQRPPQGPPVPPLPSSFQQAQPTGFAGGAFGGGFPSANFQQPTPQHSAAALLNPSQQSRFLSPSPATGGAGGLAPQQTGLVPQQTGWGGSAGGGGLSPLVAQPTGFGDPLMRMMSQTFMPANTSMPYGPGSTPQFAGPPQQAQGLSLQQSVQQHNQNVGGGPKISWALTKDERKSYDNIFRAWDPQGTGFVSGKTALEVFGQSGLSQDDLSKIWDLADSTNRGSLNLAEFHVAMGLIYRGLNGAPIPAVLPPELVPPSEKDLGESVNFLKDILSKDSHERASNGSSPNPQYGKIRSLHGTPAGDPLRGGRKDGAAYVHDDSDTRGHRSNLRHLDRRTVRYGGESPASDLDEMKRQLQSASSQLDSQIEAENSRTREDDELEDELQDLKYRVKRVQEDLDRTNRGPRSVRKDEDRRRFERELLQLLHEKIPEVERRLEEREREKQRDRDGWRRERDRRNADSSRYGRDRSDRYDTYDRDGEDDDRGYMRGSYDRREDQDWERDERDRAPNRSYSSYSRTKSPPSSTRTPPPRSSSAVGGSTRSPPPTSSTLSTASAPAIPPSPAKMTPAEKAAFVKAEAQRRMQERMRALGVSSTPAASTTSPAAPEVDSSVEERLARERKEAQEKAEKAEREAEERERARRARVEEAKGILTAPASTASPAAPLPPPAAEATRPPPAPPVPSAQAVPRAKPAPPPVKPRVPPPAPPVRGRVAPQPPKPPVVAPTPPAPAPAQPPPALPSAPTEEDDEDAKLEAEIARLREAAKVRANEQKLARRRELERQLAEAKKEEELYKATASTPLAGPKDTVSTPVQAPTSPPRELPAPSQAPAPAIPSASPAGSTNPFHKFAKPTPQSTPTVPVPPTSSSTPSIGTGTNPFFNRQAQPPAPPPPPPPAPTVLPPISTVSPPKPAPPAPVLSAPKTIMRPSSTPIPAPKTKLAQADDTDDEWDVPKEKDDDSDSSEEEFVNRAAMNKIADRIFGSGGAPPRPQSAAPALAQQQAAGIAPPPPPPPPMTAPPTAAPQLPFVAASPPVAPPPPPPAPAPATSAPAPSSGGDRNALFAAIQGGKKLKKAVTNDRSAAPVSGRVVGDAAPPAHISDVPRAVSPPSAFSPEAAPASQTLGSQLSNKSDNRQSVDWFAGLAADGGIVSKPSQSMQAMESYPEEPEESVPHITINDHDTTSDDLADVDLTKGMLPAIRKHRTRTLYAYEAQRAEEISFRENQVILAHPSKSGDVWWYGSLVRGGPKGFFPNTYVQVIDQVAQARALFSYSATTPEEMSFSEGDTLDIIDRSEADWWRTEKDGSILMVPASYLELHENLPASLVEEESRQVPMNPPKRTAPSPPRREAAHASEISSDDSDEYMSVASGDDDDKETSGDRKAEAEARALERQRVLEAAGLIIKPADASAPPRPPRKHRPPPRVPDRSSKGAPENISTSQIERDLPEIPKGEEPAMRLEDAYDRYEAFRRRQQEIPPPGNRSSIISTSSLESSPVVSSPTGTVFSLQAPSIAQSTSSSGGETARHGASAFLHSFLGRRTPGPDKKSLTISAPTISAPIPITGEIPRTPSPGFGTSWSSLVDKDVLQGIPPAERRRQEAIFELIVTEGAYVRDLQLIVEVFYTSLIDALDQKATTVIFANVEDILLCNTSFYSALEERQKDCRLYMDQVGDILQAYMGNMAVYTPYCVNQSTATKILQTIRASNPDVASCLQRLKDDPVCRNLDLSSYLLIPMQRITRYPLLLRQILNYTQSEIERQQLEWAITTTEKILDSINETIRENEGSERLAEISRDLYIGEGRLDLTARTKYLGKRKLVKEGEVTKAKSGRKLQIVLCNDVLVLMDASAHSLYRMPIPLSELKVRETPGERDDLGFQLVLAYPRGGDIISVKAASARDCHQWMQAISQASEYCKSVERRAEQRKSRSSGIGY